MTAPGSAAPNKALLGFEGQITLPPHTLESKKHLIVFLRSLETAYSSQTSADADGHFRFRDLIPGTYGLSIYSAEYYQHIAMSVWRVAQAFCLTHKCLRRRSSGGHRRSWSRNSRPRSRSPSPW